MKKLLQFFQDGTGQFSALRLVFNLSFFIFFIIWIFDSFHIKKMAPIDGSVIQYFTILLGSKVGQSISENFSPNPPTVSS